MTREWTWGNWKAYSQGNWVSHNPLTLSELGSTVKNAGSNPLNFLHSDREAWARRGKYTVFQDDNGYYRSAAIDKNIVHLLQGCISKNSRNLNTLVLVMHLVFKCLNLNLQLRFPIYDSWCAHEHLLIFGIIYLCFHELHICLVC